MAACPMAWAKWLLPVPPGPRNSASSRLPMKAQVARSKTRLRFIFGVKVKSKLSSVRCGSGKAACLRRRSSSRSLRLFSSSLTRHEIRSMGAIASVCAWRSLVSSTPAMPPSRSCRNARSNSIRFMLALLGLVVDEVAIHGELPDQRIDLAQAQRHLWVPLQVAAHKAVIADAHFQGGGASLLDAGGAVLLGQRQHSLNPAHHGLSVLAVHPTAERTDLRSGPVGATQQCQRAQRRLLGAVLVLDAMAAARLAQVLSQQLARLRVHQSHLPLV